MINNRLKLKIIVIFLTITSIISINSKILAKEEDKIVINYFYITSCSTCDEIEGLLEEVSNKENIEIIKKNIGVKENYNKFYDFLQKYNVPSNVKGIVPAIFTEDKYFIGGEDIKNGLKNISQIEDISLDEKSINNKKSAFKTLAILGGRFTRWV
ncbi:hypothetical protein [Dethiothermospora halolimnae]|uniref:hypothetical protein n=1 Tax=Dethiothermospora halolimnae TaxID=3114390 RepID=UPI003CCBF0F7